MPASFRKSTALLSLLHRFSLHTHDFLTFYPDLTTNRYSNKAQRTPTWSPPDTSANLTKPNFFSQRGMTFPRT